jgi:tRNA(Leu) C34 or U34 (ribose-2'-O)-methylase TrmL
MRRGHFGVGIYQPKNGLNYGTLFRTAQVFEADYLFVIGARFKQQASDTQKAWRHLPVFTWKTFEEFYEHLPHDTQLVGIELMEATILKDFTHPERAAYLLGSEDNGLPDWVLKKCHKKVRLPGERSLNVSVAGSIVLYDRVQK